MPLARGTQIGAYEILELLGAGGMGEVYRARDSRLGRDVAIKVLNRAASANPRSVRRFESEARAASALNHPGIVTIHDTGQSDGQFYIVMELVDGITLRHLLRRGAPGVKKVLHIAGQLAAALAQAHDAGVVHRDLKPENVMVTRDDHVKIVDFGLAKLAEPEEGRDESATQSGEGAMIGTVGYMAPEQVRGERTDFRADQFAFGAILYELVTGARAFHRGTPVETMAMILNEEPPSLTGAPAVPAPVVWTIERCLAKDADHRYASTRDLAREVQTLREHAVEFVARRPPALAERRRLLLLAAAFLSTAAVASYISLQGVGTRLSDPEAGRFTQLTFGLGNIVNARFAPDGQTVFYAAGWRGAPVQVFETRPTGPESRPVGPSGTSLAGIAATGELALIMGCRLDWGNCVGTLARMPQGGGAPREVMENVVSADWGPDGQALAAIQMSDGEYHVQFPLGHTLYTSTSRLAYLRFSPRGDRLAFIEYDLISDERGVLKVVAVEGGAATVWSRFSEIREIAWPRDSDEVWVSAIDRGRSTSIYAVSSTGARRLILQAPGSLYLQDVAADGRALVTRAASRAHMVWSSEVEQRDLSWLDWSSVADISADGKTVLFYEWGQAVGARPVVYLRRTTDADAVRLGDGKALALSPDTRWAVALQELPQPHLVLLPTGAGEIRSLPAEPLTDFYWARWFPDGQRLLVVGEDRDGVPASWVQQLDSGRLEPITEKGVLAVLVSPDGRRLLAADPLDGYLLWPLDGGPRVPLPSLDRNDRPLQWSADGQSLYVRDIDGAVALLHRLHIGTGRRELVTTLAPRDPTGVIGIGDGRGELVVTADGDHSAFTYWSFVGDLFLVELPANRPGS